MTQLFSLTLIIHVAAGAASLVLFWIPVAVRKGSKIHRRSGHWYARCMYLVAVSALILSGLLGFDPVGIKHSGENLSMSQGYDIASQRRGTALFLFAIGVLVIANLRQGLLTLGESLSRVRTRALNHTALNAGLAVLALLLAWQSYRHSSILYLLFALLCSGTAASNLRYAWRVQIDRLDRVRSHLSSMIGAGIASHTAFFVFGANRFLGEYLGSQWQLVPWIAPGVVGGTIISVLLRRYQRKPRTAGSA